MTTSFYNGIAGLISFQKGIDVWGDNIANVNTPGFKQSLPEFETLFSKTLNMAAAPTADIGLGSTLSSTAKDMSIGSFVETNNPFDLALGKKGWLCVERNGKKFYTRNGEFTRDAQGYLVDDSGDYLLVANANNLVEKNGTYYINRDVNTDNLLPSDNLSPISLPDNVILPAVPTKNIKLIANLLDSENITTTKPATLKNDFSALYNKDGQDMQIRNGDDLVFGFGNSVKYNQGILSTSYCIPDITQSGKENISFSINSKQISLTIKTPATGEEIASQIASVLNENGIQASADQADLTISSRDKLIITSNTPFIKNTAAAVLTYESDPQNQYQFATMDDFVKEIQNLADTAYPNEVQVSLDNDGRIVVQNLTDTNLNSFALKADHTNDSFFTNLGRAGNEIYANTANKSYAFLTNTQSFGGYAIDADGNKNPVTIIFTKQKIQPGLITWDGTISINTPNGEISKETSFTFDDKGNLLQPKTLTVDNIDFTFNLTAYQSTNTSTSYSFNQDGILQGYLKNYQITDDGKILGIFSNGKQATLGQIPVFHFQNPQGLESIGDSLFMESSNSGKAFLYTDENGNYLPTKILPGMVEQSNVNFSQAMTELIINQKAFQASAKTVTTSDEMIKRAINMVQ